MIRRPPRSTRTDTLFPYTTLFRSLAFARREVLEIARRAACAAGIHPHHRIAIGHPFLRIDHLPALMDIARAARNVRVVLAHQIPAGLVDLLEVEVLAVGAVGHDHRILPVVVRSAELRVGTESVRTCRYRGSPD